MADVLAGTGTLDPADLTAFTAHVHQAADVYQDLVTRPPQGMTAEQALRALTQVPSHRLTAALTRDERDRLLHSAHRSAPITADERHLIAQTRTELRNLAGTDTEQAFTDHDILQALRAAEPVAGKNPLPRRAQTTAQTLLNHGRPVTLPGGTRHHNDADSLFGDTPSRDTTPGLALPGQSSRDTRPGQTPQDRLTHATSHRPPAATRPTPIDIDSLIPANFSQEAEQALGADAYLAWTTPDHHPPAWARGDQLPALTNQQIDEIFTVAETNPNATYGSIWDHINATYNTQLTPEEINRLHHNFTQHTAQHTNESPREVPRWERPPLAIKLKAAQQYFERTGDLKVPSRHIENVEGKDMALGKWLDDVRRGHSDPYGDARIALNSMKMRWEKERGNVEKWLKAAEQYHKRVGKLSTIPSHHKEKVEGKDMALEKWLDDVRSLRQKIDQNTWNKLDEMGMRWEKTEPRGVAENWLKAAEQYYKRKGSLGKVPVRHKEKIEGKDVNLGNWLKKVRDRPESIDQDTRAKLDSMEMRWEKERGNVEKWLKAAEQYHKRKGSLGTITSKHKENVEGKDMALGNWLDDVRSLRQKIDQNTWNKLDEMGMRWREQAAAAPTQNSQGRSGQRRRAVARVATEPAPVVAVEAPVGSSSGGVVADLAARRGLRVEEVPGDGDCFMASLARVLPPEPSGVEWSAAAVRREIATDLIEDLDQDPEQRWLWPLIETALRMDYAESVARQAGAVTQEERRQRYDRELAAVDAAGGVDDGYRRAFAERLATPGHWTSLAGDVAPALAAMVWGVRLQVVQVVLPPGGVGEPQEAAYPIGETGPVVHLVRSYERSAAGPVGEHWSPAYADPELLADRPASELGQLSVDDWLLLKGQEPATEAENTQLTAYPDTAGLSPQDQADLILAWRQTDTHIPWPDDPMTWEQDPHTAPWQPDTDMAWEPPAAGRQEDWTAYPMVDPLASLIRSQDFADAHHTLDSVTEPGVRDTLLAHATMIMHGRHQAPPATPAEPGSAAAAYQSLHRDMTALIAAHLLTNPDPWRDITDPHHPAHQLSEQLREEFATHAPHPEITPPTTTGPFIGMALTHNDTTDTLQQVILQDRLNQLTPGTPEHTRLQAVLDTHTTTGSTAATTNTENPPHHPATESDAPRQEQQAQLVPKVFLDAPRTPPATQHATAEGSADQHVATGATPRSQARTTGTESLTDHRTTSSPPVDRPASERDLRAIRYMEAAQKFERALAAHVMTSMPEVAEQIRTITAAAWDLVAEQSPTRLDAFGRNDPTAPGAVGTDLETLRRTVRDGNLREHMAMLNFAIHGRVFEKWFRIPRLSAIEDQRSQRRSVAKQRTWEKPSEVQPPLSAAERAFAVTTDEQGNEQLLWARGEDYTQLVFSGSLHQQSEAVGGLVSTGVSGSTTSLLSLAKGIAGLTGITVDMRLVRLAALGAFAAVGHHTAHEVMLAAQLWDDQENGSHGLDYDNDPRRYRRIAPLTENELRQFIAPDGLFPDEHAIATPTTTPPTPASPSALASRTTPTRLDTSESASSEVRASTQRDPVSEPVQPLRRDTESHQYLLDTRLLPAADTPAYTEHVKTAAAMLRGPDTTPAQQASPPIVSITPESQTDPLSTLHATDFLNAITRLPHTASTIQLDLGHAATINICR